MSSSGRGHVRGPLAPYAEGFREDLLGQGYTWGSAAHQIHLMAHVSRWLEAQGLELAVLDEGVTERFVAARPGIELLSARQRLFSDEGE